MKCLHVSWGYFFTFSMFSILCLLFVANPRRPNQSVGANQEFPVRARPKPGSVGAIHELPYESTEGGT